MGPLSSKDIKSITSSKTIPEHKNNTLAKALSAAYPLRKIEGVEAIATSLLNIISKQCKKKIGQIKLIFRGSEHKFRSNAFH